MITRIEQAAADTQLAAAHAYVGNRAGVDSRERDARVAYLELDWLTTLLQPKLNLLNARMGWGFALSRLERLQYGAYGPGGHHGWHADQLLPGAAAGGTDPRLQRKLSFVISLNGAEDYEGGEFEVEYGRPEEPGRHWIVEELRQAGTLAVFPSFLYHRVRPVRSGERRTLVGFVSGPPFC